MKDSIEIGGLFKVYFLWKQYYYIELLRPLESKDFVLVSPIEQSISFIKDKGNWFYELSFKHRSNGSKYDLVYKAKQSYQLRYKEELINGICNHIDKSHGEIRNSLESIFSLYHSKFHIKYDYKGCPNQDSQYKKDERILQELMVKVENDGEKKLSYMYEKAFQEVENKINFHNTPFLDNVKRAVKDNEEYHDNIRKKYDEKNLAVVDAIEQKRLEISKLKNEIKELEVSVQEHHRELVGESINSWDDFPQAVKDECKEIAMGLNLYGVGGSMFDRSGIYIRRAKETT